MFVMHGNKVKSNKIHLLPSKSEFSLPGYCSPCQSELDLALAQIDSLQSQLAEPGAPSVAVDDGEPPWLERLFGEHGKWRLVQVRL